MRKDRTRVGRTCRHGSRGSWAGTQFLALGLLSLTLGGCGSTLALPFQTRPTTMLRKPAQAPVLQDGIVLPPPDVSGFATEASWLVTPSGVYAADSGKRPSHEIRIWYQPWPRSGKVLRFPRQPDMWIFLSVGRHQGPVLLGSPGPGSVILAVEGRTGLQADVAASVWLVSARQSRRLADLVTRTTRPIRVRGQEVVQAGSGMTILGIGARQGFPDAYLPAATEMAVDEARSTVRVCPFPAPVAPALTWPFRVRAGPKALPWIAWIRPARPSPDHHPGRALVLAPACQAKATPAASDVLSVPAGTAVLWPTVVAGPVGPTLTGFAGARANSIDGWARSPSGTGLRLRWQIRTDGAAVLPMPGSYALVSQSEGTDAMVRLLDLETGRLSKPLPGGNILSATGGAVLLGQQHRLVFVRVRSPGV